ncbi:MAG: Holliday junction branch migration protein RuvA [Deltaproteobacteria bacterium]|nr:Holliday junction branch migration protein RuvA [Deltaproteobacteria bacterium]
MIDYLGGILKEVNEAGGVIEVGGVGVRVEMSLKDISELPAIEEEIKLFVRPILRDDSLLLYGFTSTERRYLFNLLISVPTVGPSLALSLISSMDLAEIAGAIISEDHERLSSVQGIGKKTAQKIIIELKDKLRRKMHDLSLSSVMSLEEREMKGDVMEALVSLGFSKQDSFKTFSEIYQRVGKEKPSVDNIIMLCLKKLGKEGARKR